MTRPTTSVCLHCLNEFPVTNVRGPVPRYCSAAHKHRAHDNRKTRIVQALREMAKSECVAIDMNGSGAHSCVDWYDSAQLHLYCAPCFSRHALDQP